MSNSGDASIWGGNNPTIPLVNASNSYLVSRFIALLNQTVFNITAFVFVPSTNSIQVFLNGVFQTTTQDYIEDPSGTFITFTSPLKAGDIVVCVGIVGVTGAPQAAISAAAALASQIAAAASQVSAATSATTATTQATNALNSANAAAASAMSVVYNAIPLVSHGTT